MPYADSLRRVNTAALRAMGKQHVLNGLPVQGDFVEAGKTFTLSDMQEIQALVPLLVVADGDVPVAPVGKAATCNGQNYSVEEAKPDGHGLTVLELQVA